MRSLMHSRGRRPSVPGIATLSLAAALAFAGCSSSGSDAVEPAQTLETVAPTDAPTTDATLATGATDAAPNGGPPSPYNPHVTMT